MEQNYLTETVLEYNDKKYSETCTVLITYYVINIVKDLKLKQLRYQYKESGPQTYVLPEGI